jgi:hypothetical protein
MPDKAVCGRMIFLPEREKKMLAAKKLPLVLQSQLSEGLEGVCLLTIEGSILCSASLPKAKVDETSLAAITTSVWNQYSQGKYSIIFECSSVMSIFRN